MLPNAGDPATTISTPLPARRARTPLELLSVSIVAGLSAWVSLGILTVTDAGPSGVRVGLLPPWWVPVAAAVAALAVLWPLGRRGLPASPLFLLAVTLVPWLPLPLSGTLLLWAGPLTAWVWAAALAAWLAPLAPRWGPRPLAAFVLAAAIFGAAAWQMREARPSGDEPHYLVIVQSLLLDGDLRIENNHQRRDYAAYFGGLIRPHYLKRGTDRQIYSIHAPGLPVLVAPAFALGGYQAVVALLVLLSALGTVVVWRSTWLLTGDVGAAWFAWAASFAAPFFFHSYAVYPDALGSVLVATGVLALVRLEAGRATTALRWAVHGAALAALPWLHTRFAVAAAVLGSCIALRLVARLRASGASARQARQAEARAVLAFLAVPVISAAAWFGYFHAIWGTFNPAAPYGGYTQTSASNVLRGLPGLLLDQQFGILPNAPVYLCALAGLWWLGRRRLRLALELSLLVVASLAAASAYHMWWGGWSAPARFAVPTMLTLGVAAGACWAGSERAGRAVCLLLLGLSGLVTATMTLARGGRLIFNTRDGFARWLDFAAPNVDLPRAVPSFFRDGRPLAFAQAAAWLAALTLVILAIRALVRVGERSRGGRVPLRLSVAVPLITVLAGSAAVTAAWQMGGASASGVSPLAGQLALLRKYDPGRLPVGLRYGSGRPFDAALVPPELVLRAPRGRPVAEGVLLSVGALAPGIYAIESRGGGDGTVVARLGRDERSIASWSLSELAGGGGRRIELPAGAAALAIEGDEAARAAAGELTLRPISVIPPGERAYSQFARRAAVYGDTTVFAFDDSTWLEGPGLWVQGGVPASLVVAKANARRVEVRLRNGHSPNRVAIEGGGWRSELRMAAREERTVEVPLRGTPPAALLQVRTEGGFTPSKTTPGSGDERYLGVWIEIAR